MNDLRQKGAVFVEILDDIPRGEKVVFSAHGVAKHRMTDAADRGL